MTKKDALAREANKDPVTFEYDGDTYTIPHPKLWPLEVLEKQENGRYVGATEELLGAAQWKAFRGKPRTVEDLDDLSNALFEAVDTTKGESSS